MKYVRVFLTLIIWLLAFVFVHVTVGETMLIWEPQPWWPYVLYGEVAFFGVTYILVAQRMLRKKV